jgi:hypothetical protein
MELHQDQVRATLEALTYLVKDLDPNGIDLYFTMSDTVGHEKHTSRLLKLFDEVGFCDEQANMDFALSRILEGNNKRRWGLSSLTGSSERGKMVYVLTDAKWHGNRDLDGMPELIKRQVVKTGSNARDKLAIQFIQFGEDSLGTWRLKELDGGLEGRGVDEYVLTIEAKKGLS